MRSFDNFTIENFSKYNVISSVLYDNANQVHYTKFMTVPLYKTNTINIGDRCLYQ